MENYSNKKLCNIKQKNKTQYNSRLYNEDLAPTLKQNWNWYNIFLFWMSDVHSIGGYVVASSFFTCGLQSWQILLCLLTGIWIVQHCANLIAKPSQMAGVPYKVICRQAFGVFGANVPSIIRQLIFFSWHGIQTYMTANALMFVLLHFFPTLISMTHVFWLGLSQLGWICFGVICLFQTLIFYHGTNTIKCFINSAGPPVYLILAGLVSWIIYKITLHGINLNLSHKKLTISEQAREMTTITSLIVSYFSTSILNFCDFSRYAKNMKEIYRGNYLGLPLNFLFSSITTIIMVLGIQLIFGKTINNQIETISKVNNDLTVTIALITIIFSTIGINIAANFISSIFNFSNLSLRKNKFNIGDIITSIGSALLIPWNLFQSPGIIQYTLNIISIFVGPLFGILISDFYLIKKEQINVEDLFNDSPQGAYWYKNGYNFKAICSFIPPVIIGFLITFIPQLHLMVDFSLFIGSITAGICYFYAAKSERTKNHIYH